MSKPAKAAGGVKKRDDSVYDLEQQLILRLPAGPAMALRREVEAGAMNLKDKLFVELQPDMRHGKVAYGGQVMNAKLMDLPCIIECLKTTDQKNFYKTSDICQLLVCSMEDDDEVDVEGNSPTKNKDKDKKFQWNHGIAPPLKNVRKRRFRKTLKKKYQEQPDIEKEVKRLFRADNEAIDVKWEVVVEEEKPENQSGGDKQVLAQGESNIMDEDDIGITPKPSNANLLEVAEHEIFGDVSSSDEEEGFERDITDVTVMDSGNEDTNMSFSRVDTRDSLVSMGEDSNFMAGDDTDLESKLQELRQQIDELREQRLAAQAEVMESDGMTQDPNLQQDLDELIQAENEKQQEYEILASMVNDTSIGWTHAMDPYSLLYFQLLLYLVVLK